MCIRDRFRRDREVSRTAGVRLRSQKRVDKSEDAVCYCDSARPQLRAGGTYCTNCKMFRKERRVAEVCTATYDDGPELSSIRAIKISVENSTATNGLRVLVDTVATMVR